MKKLLTSLVVGLSLIGSVSAVEVHRPYQLPIFQITEKGAYIKFWRQVCTEEDVSISVSKVWKKVENGKVVKTYRDFTLSEYFFTGREECYGEVFSVNVLDTLPNGDYVFSPQIRVNGLPPFINIPTENVRIDR